MVHWGAGWPGCRGVGGGGLGLSRGGWRERRRGRGVADGGAAAGRRPGVAGFGGERVLGRGSLGRRGLDVDRSVWPAWMLALLVLSPLVASRSVEKVVGLAGSRVAERRAVSRLLRVWAIALCATADVLEARSVLGGRGRISDGEAMPLDSFFAHSLSSARKMWDNGILYAILNYRLKSNNHLRRQSQGRRWSGIFEAHNLQTFVNKHGRHSEPRS